MTCHNEASLVRAMFRLHPAKMKAWAVQAQAILDHCHSALKGLDSEAKPLFREENFRPLFMKSIIGWKIDVGAAETDRLKEAVEQEKRDKRASAVAKRTRTRLARKRQTNAAK